MAYGYEEELEKLARLRAGALQTPEGFLGKTPLEPSFAGNTGAFDFRVPEPAASAEGMKVVDVPVPRSHFDDIESAFNAPDIAGPRSALKPRAPEGPGPDGDVVERFDVPTVIDAPDGPPQTLRASGDDDEYRRAQDFDAQMRFIRDIGDAASTGISTATRTQRVAPMEFPEQVKALLAKRHQKRESDLTAMGMDQAQQTAKRTEAYLEDIRNRGDLSTTKAERDKFKAELEAELAKKKDERAGVQLTIEQQEAARKKAKDAQDASEAAANLEIRRKQLEIEQDKANKQASAGLAHGWERLPDSNATTTQLSEHAKLVASEEKMQGLIDEMRAALKQHGGGLKKYIPGTNSYSVLQQIATQLGVEGKNVAELGALSGPDFKLMMAINKDPTSLFNMNIDMDQAMQSLAKWGRNSVQAKSKAIGVVRQAATGGGKADDGPGKVEVISTKTGKPVLLSPKAAELMIKSGKARPK